MQDHISKPIDEEILLQSVRKWALRSSYNGNHEADEQTPSTTSTHSVVNYPRHIDIDFNAALARLQHNLTLYVNLINRLQQDYQNAPQKIVDLLVKGQHQQAQRFFHSLKGAAANLGLIRLHKVASQLEQHMAHGELDSLADLITKIDPLLNQAQAAAADLVLWHQRRHKPGNSPS
jgi:HPt (histidine-containing phosphotransfer) domain-containing protein